MLYIYTAVVIKLFLKPISKTWKGFGKPLINRIYIPQFINGVPKPFHGKEIGFQN
jgi:hypothetical protein